MPKKSRQVLNMSDAYRWGIDTLEYAETLSSSITSNIIVLITTLSITTIVATVRTTHFIVMLSVLLVNVIKLSVMAPF
jgi:hypothetical protein